jgi:protein TonB
VATPWPTATHGRTIAGWELTYNDNGCEIYAEYDLKGGTDVSLNLNLDGTGTLLVGNKKWSITQGETVKLDFLVNGAAYQGTALGVSERFDQSKMFGAKLPPEFITDFAASPYLIVTKGATTVTRVSLSGSAEAIKAARRCVETVRAAAAAVEAKKRRESDIADDPFAQPASERGPASFAVPGGPKGNPGSWFTDSDYPADAKRAGAQGSVSLLLSVDTAGKVAGCRVTASSGNASLDNATCRLAERRGRFNVQKDAEGNALPYAYSLPGIHWSLKSQ